MDHGYYHKILDAWVPSVAYLPRWFSANSYPTLTDPIQSPGLTTLTTGSLVTLATGSVLPTDWVLTSHTVYTSGSVIQRLLEVIAHEASIIDAVMQSVAYSQTLLFDEADTEFVWVVPAPETVVEDVQVLNSADVKVTIPKAKDEIDLFWSADRRWIQSEGLIIIAGLDIQEQQSETRTGAGDWQFISSASKWSSGAVVFWEHPQTRNFVPIHPASIRSDGFLGLNYSGTLKLRCRHTQAAQSLPQITVYVNNEQRVAKRANAWNTVDEAGLREGLSRRVGESNVQLGRAIVFLNWYGRQTAEGLEAQLAACLRQGDEQTFTTDSTLTFPASATGYKVRGWESFSYTGEVLSYDVDTPSRYRTIYDDPELPSAFFKGLSTPVTNVSGNVYTVDATVRDNKAVSPMVFWKLSYWTDTGSSLVFTSNMPDSDNVSQLRVFFPQNVSVETPSNQLLRSSFKKVDPSLRWGGGEPLDKIQGLATFT